MKYTQQQVAAITTHDRNVIVVAGAGSGKTRVLVARYMALLDANPGWPLDALVAITFTKKAAEEMRDRVRRELETCLATAAAADEIARWTTLYGQVSSARIDTIHGLCASLLRANAAWAGVDPDFQVLDETDAAILLEDAVDATLAEAAVDDDLVELFVEYDSLRLRETLLDAALINADLPPLPDDLLARWQADWDVNAAGQVSFFLEGADAIDVWSPPDGDKLGEMWAICLNALEALRDTKAASVCWNSLNAIAGVSLQGGTQKSWGSKEKVVEARADLRKLRELAEAALAAIGEPPGDVDARAAELLPLWANLIARVRDRYTEAKARRSLLDFDDLEALTRDLLRGNPDVCARYRGREFRHLLVDEFQDTNAAQWDIVQALGGLDLPGSMFVVGDQKQSIYAFRGADVSVFDGVRGQITGQGGVEIPLSESFRTHAPLVDCFNDLFGRLLVRDQSSPVSAYQVELGEPLTAFRKQAPVDDPIMEILLIDQQESGAGDEQEKLKAEQRREWEAAEIARRLDELIASGRLIYDRESGEARPIEYGDVAILFQSLVYVNFYEEALKAHGIPFVTTAGRGYYNRQEVWDLLNLLAALHNPSDDLALAAALRSPMFALSDDALFALRLVRREDGSVTPLWDALALEVDLLPDDERERVAFARDCLYALHGAAGRVTISELLRMALARTGYLALLTGLPDGARRRGNVEKLLEKAETGGYVTLGAFSRHLHDLSAREAREGEAAVDVTGVVNLMTVHASKGLEFPVVVLADASWKRRGGSADLLLYDRHAGLACRMVNPDDGSAVYPYHYNYLKSLAEQRDEAERLRLFYVAATRAADLLIVTGQAAADKSGQWKSGGWLARLLDALELTEELDSASEFVQPYEWGSVRVRLPGRRPPSLEIAAESADAWDADPDANETAPPPLLAEVSVSVSARARHLAATQIADLGSCELAKADDERRFYRERFRRQVLQDAPGYVEDVNPLKPQAITNRHIGEIVHEALRHWQLPGDDAAANDGLRTLLYNYAWRYGISDPMLCADAARRAYKLLARFKSSEMYQWINDAEAVYRELPFVYERDGYVIHGVIDVLFRSNVGQWILVDYKTGYVESRSPDDLAEHARRYHLQLGIYAEAVREQLGIVPLTYIQFIRYMRMTRVNERDWRAALERNLEHRVLEIIGNQPL